MSYDFRLFRPKAGEDPLVTARQDSGDFPDSPPDKQKEAQKRQVAEALIAHNPNLEVFQFGYDEIAELEKISPSEARLKYRHLELNGPEDGNGIQITLFDDEASVTVPYWHEGEKASDTFSEIWGYLEIIHREAGYLVYDPQLDRLLDTPADYDAALARYTGVVRKLRKATSSTDTKKKPWWKFW